MIKNLNTTKEIHLKMIKKNTPNIMDIAKIRDISKSKLDIDLEDYFENNETTLSIFVFNRNDNKFNLLNGTQNDLNILNDYCSGLVNETILAGYLNKKIINETHLYSENSKLESDIIFFVDNLFENDEEFVEMILIHELCHLLEKSNYYREINIQFTKMDTSVGDKISKTAERLDDYDHNFEFGALLSHYSEKVFNKRKYEMIEKSMRTCLGSDFTIGLK